MRPSGRKGRVEQSAEKQGQALREAQDKAKKLATELAAVRRAVQSQEAVASSAKDEAAGVKEAAERSADEQRRALQQERDRTEKLTAELAEAKSSLETQTKAKAAEEAARDSQLAALRQELQKAKAEATVARESLEAERTRTAACRAAVASIQESTERSWRPLAGSSAPTVGQPSTAALRCRKHRRRSPTEDVQRYQRTLATRPANERLSRAVRTPFA